MATVKINDTGQPPARLFSSDTVAPKGTSTVSLAGGWFFYSNNPETFDGTAVADVGAWLNYATVSGTGQIYVWHKNNTGSSVKACILLHNYNNFDITVSVPNYGVTNKTTVQPDSDAWLNFYSATPLSMTPVTIAANTFRSFFLDELGTITNGSVHGIIARMNIVQKGTTTAAGAKLYDIAYYSNTGSLNKYAALTTSLTGKQRGLGSTGYYNTITFEAVEPTSTQGFYYSLGKSTTTFGGADMPLITDGSSSTTAPLLGNYGVQMNVNFKLKNTTSAAKIYRIYIGSTGGSIYPLLYYGGTAYKRGSAGATYGIPSGQSWDLLELSVPANTTTPITESFQIVVPAVSAAPVVVGARVGP